MHNHTASRVNAFTAHREWATRPADERYTSVEALHQAAVARRRVTEAHHTSTTDLHVHAISDSGLEIREPSGAASHLTHWSFEQLAGLAAAPPAYLRTLPASIASDAINYGLSRSTRLTQQLFTDRETPRTLHAITSTKYARVHHDDLTSRVIDLMTDHSTWQLPLGYKNGIYGSERVPSGAYLGDRDMFVFLVDGNRDVDDPTDTSHAGLFRGFILRNSDVGAAALSIDLFLFRAVCCNHVIWGFQHVASLRRRHIGTSIHDAWSTSLQSIQRAIDAPVADDHALLLRAISRELGTSKDEVIETGVQRLELSRKQAVEAYEQAERYEQNPRSIWGYVQGLTRLSQHTEWQDARFDLDRAASRLFRLVS